MAHEAAGTGKPLHLFDLPTGGAWLPRALQAADQALRSGPAAGLYACLIKGGWAYAPRDPASYFSRLIAEGRAVRLGDAFPNRPPAAGATPDTDRAARAIRGLMGL